MNPSLTTNFEQATGRLILRCDARTFEQLKEVVCREGEVFVPLSIPPTPVRAVSIVLAADEPPPRVSLAREVVAVVLAVLLLCGPIGLFVLVRWIFGY